MSNVLEHVPGYRIKTVASMTGLSTHVIRKWEQRYHLLQPHREANTYRIYTEEDIQLLLYVKTQLAQGESIGQLSQSGEQALKRSMQETPLNLSNIPMDYQRETLHIIQAARRQQIDVIQQILTGWVTQEGLEHTLEMVLFPLLRLIGELWHEGGISISGEHHVTRCIRQHLVTGLRAGSQHGQPQALLACVPGEYHEVGALTAAFLLQNRGWQITYLGPNVPFEVLQMALRRTQAALIIMSCTTDPGPERGRQWCETIAQRLAPFSQVMVGGAGFSGYSDLLAQHEILYLRQMKDVKSLDPNEWTPQ